MPAHSPTQTDPDVKATAAEKNADARILPSSPMSKTPARSEYSPARHANNKGVASRTVESRICRMVRKSMISTPAGGAYGRDIGADAHGQIHVRQLICLHHHRHSAGLRCSAASLRLRSDRNRLS